MSHLNSSLSVNIFYIIIKKENMTILEKFDNSRVTCASHCSLETPANCVVKILVSYFMGPESCEGQLSQFIIIVSDTDQCEKRH